VEDCLIDLRLAFEGCFSSAVVEQEHATDIEYVEKKSRGVFSFLSFLDSRYRSIKKRWVSYRVSSFQGSMIDQANEMKQVDKLRAERIAINEARDMGHSLFGPLWQGEQSSWDVLDTYVNWVLEFRGLCVKHGLAGRIVEVASNPAPDISDVQNLQQQANAAREQLQALRKALGWPESYLEETAVEQIRNRADAIFKNIAQAPQWAAFETARVAVHVGLAGELLPAVFSGELSFQDMSAAFLRAFYMKWLSLVVQERPPLAKFNTLTHDQRVREFRHLDERVLLENQAALVSTLRDRVQHRL
jgi:hypothetical protein